MDFVLKILNVEGRGKVRVQLWDMAGGNSGASSTLLAPLFIRKAVACIVVARPD